MPASRPLGTPWHASLNIDLFLTILRNSIFHPFVASLLPLCLRAAEVPYSAPAFRNTVYWAIFVCVCHVLAPINQRIAFGKPRKVDWEQEVVLVTGGARGLGRCVAEIYALRGATVGVLDVERVDEGQGVEGVRYWTCDVGDVEAVERVWGEVEKELGRPTILFNNAGIMHNKPLLELTPAEVSKTFTTNTLCHYHTTSLFLRPLLHDPTTGGTLITISSVLGHLGAANLSAYTASKAALLAYHASLTAELTPYPHIKTILAAPGHLSTDLFDELRQSRLQRFVGPVVEVQELAMRLVKMVDEGRGGRISLPAYAEWIEVFSVLPVGLQKLLRDWAGVDTAIAAAEARVYPSEKQSMS